MKRTAVMATLLLLLVGGELQAQGDMILNPSGGGALFRIGLLGGVIYQNHTGEFTLTENEIRCCTFDGGTGLGPVVAIRGEYLPDPDGILAVALRLGISSEGGTFTSEQEVLPILGVGNGLSQGVFENDIDVKSTTIEVAPLAMIRLLDLDLYFSLGPVISQSISTQTDLTERLVAPERLTYLDGTRERSRENIPATLAAETRFSLSAGLDLRIPITEKIGLASELHYRHPLSSFGEVDEAWEAIGVLGTLGVTLSL